MFKLIFTSKKTNIIQINQLRLHFFLKKKLINDILKNKEKTFKNMKKKDKNAFLSILKYAYNKY